jgi:hypothetical protein
MYIVVGSNPSRVITMYELYVKFVVNLKISLRRHVLIGHFK